MKDSGALDAAPPPLPPRVLLMFDRTRVLSLRIDRPNDKPITVVEQAAWFRCHPSGHFILADRPFMTPPGARWYVGHVKGPKAVKEVSCPLRDDEVVKDAALSNDGGRVVWATFRPKRDGRLLVTRVADGTTTVVLERPALGHFRTFGPPTWSPDDRRVAVVYLRSPGIRPDPERLVSLIEIDLSGEKPTDRLIVPAPFACNDNESATPIWSPDGKQLIVPKAEAAFDRGGFDHSFVVTVDGGDMKRADDLVFLDDHVHAVTGLKFAPLPGGEWTQMTAQLLDTATGKSTPLKYESPVEAAVRKWSPDGRSLLVGLYNQGQQDPAAAVRLVLIDTATGEKRTLIDTNTAVGQDRHLTFVSVPAAR